MANHREVVDEYKRAQLPINYEKKREWANLKLKKVEEKDKAKAEGIDYERKKYLEIQADEAERWERKQKEKHNPDIGFSSYEDSTARQYNRFVSLCFCLFLIACCCLFPFNCLWFQLSESRLVKQFKPDMNKYEQTKEEVGEAFYPTKDTIIHGIHKDSKESIDRMVDDLNTQVDKRHKFSRRRRFDDDADIDYINEKNMRFNKNLERFYGQYTTEIKQNLERGTAV